MEIGDLVRILYNQQIGIITRVINDVPHTTQMAEPQILEIMSEGRTRGYLPTHVEVIDERG